MVGGVLGRLRTLTRLGVPHAPRECTIVLRYYLQSDPLSLPPVPSVFNKLNLKGHEAILVLNAPDAFEKELRTLRDVRVFRRIGDAKSFGFMLAFATSRAEVDRLSKALCAKAAGDCLLWFAYPKSTSKKYSCDFNRDNGWAVLQKNGFDTVRQVAIDEDWSALRFRRVDFITRSKP